MRHPKGEETKQFTFDNVYDSSAEQKVIYEDTAGPIVESVMEGYNGTIFAYGQTGTVTVSVSQTMVKCRRRRLEKYCRRVKKFDVGEKKYCRRVIPKSL